MKTKLSLYGSDFSSVCYVSFNRGMFSSKCLSTDLISSGFQSNSCLIKAQHISVAIPVLVEYRSVNKENHTVLFSRFSQNYNKIRVKVLETSLTSFKGF